MNGKILARALFTAFVAVLLFAPTAFAGAPVSSEPVQAGKMSFAEEPVETITVGELKDLVNARAKVLIIDTRVRGDYEMSDVKIKGAISIPLLELEKNLPAWPLDGEIVTYCT